MAQAELEPPRPTRLQFGVDCHSRSRATCRPYCCTACASVVDRCREQQHLEQDIQIKEERVDRGSEREGCMEGDMRGTRGETVMTEQEAAVSHLLP
jgi:hypothetical protein